MFRQMSVCSFFADRLLGALSGFIPNMPTKSGIMACFRIPLADGYALSVSVPSDKNMSLETSDAFIDVTVETALFKNNKLVYDDELGYSDVRVPRRQRSASSVDEYDSSDAYARRA